MRANGLEFNTVEEFFSVRVLSGRTLVTLTTIHGSKFTSQPSGSLFILDAKFVLVSCLVAIASETC
jgi:hypothetical protein